MLPSTIKTSTSRHSAAKPSCETPCDHMGANRSDVVQAVHRLDVDLDVFREVERGTEIGVQLTRRKRSRPPVVDTYAIGRGRR